MTETKLFRYGLPAVVSVGLLAVIFSRVPIEKAIESVTPEAALWSSLAVLAFVAVTLVLEALSFSRAAQGLQTDAGLATWARVKAASYAPQMVHHALGLAVLTYLIRKRLELNLGQAAGIVAMMPLFDLLALMLIVATAAASTGMAGPVSLPVLAVIAASVVLGLVWLRSEASLGPLDQLRELAPFEATREAPLRKLFELGALRIVFTASFIALWGASLGAFGIEVPVERLAIGIAIVALASTLPSVSGFGTSQAAFLAMFDDFASAEALLGCNLFVSVIMVGMRVALSLLFAGEFTRDALIAVQSEEESGA